MITVKMPIALITTFLWIGFVCAISFMEAWLKFKAQGITLPVGLGIGRLVFNAVKGDEFYDYSLKLDTSIVSKSNLVKHRPFIGAIESNSDNVFAILAGLYLMEIEFDNEDGDIG